MSTGNAPLSMSFVDMYTRQIKTALEYERAGFVAVNCNEELRIAAAFMKDAGFIVEGSSSALKPIALRSKSILGDQYMALDIPGARGAYSQGVILLRSDAPRSTLVHECVHHLQGCFTGGIRVPVETPYRECPHEMEAHLIQRAFEMERSPRSIWVRIKHILAGWKIPSYL